MMVWRNGDARADREDLRKIGKSPNKSIMQGDYTSLRSLGAIPR